MTLRTLISAIAQASALSLVSFLTPLLNPLYAQTTVPIEDADQQLPPPPPAPPDNDTRPGGGLAPRGCFL